MTATEQAQRLLDDWKNGVPRQYSEAVDVMAALVDEIAKHQWINETFAGFDELKAEIHRAAARK